MCGCMKGNRQTETQFNFPFHHPLVFLTEKVVGCECMLVELHVEKVCYAIRQLLYSIYIYKKRKFFHEVFFGWVSVERSGGLFVPCVRLCCCWRKDKFFINATPAIFCAIPSSYTSASMFPSSSPTKHSYVSEEYCCF